MIVSATPQFTEIHARCSTSVAPELKGQIVASDHLFNFTQKKLLPLPPAAPGKRDYYTDDPKDKRYTGLKLSVTPKGIKTFFLQRRIQGRPERVTIGRFPDLTIAQARERVITLNAAIAGGLNPAQEHRLKRAQLTLGEFFGEYINHYAKPYKKQWQEDVNQFRRYLQNWEEKKLTAIHKQDIQTLHSHVGSKNGIYAANRVLALLHAVFNKAIDWGFMKGSNPAHGVKKYKEKSRDRFLQADELPRFFKALEEETNHTIRDCILICLLTGARRGNVMAMRWEELNLKAGIWTIPDTKSGDTDTIPLVDEATKILGERKVSAAGEWVFPGSGKTGHLVEIKLTWQRILERAGISNLRIHDLRRTMGSWQAAQGASLAIIGKSLTHKNVSTTLIYSRLNLDPVRESMEKATSAILSAAGVLSEGEVVDIKESK